MVEDASGVPVAENYGWYDDNRLKTYPGPGYTRLLDYDEEGRLTSIKRDNGTTQTLAYEYAYGFDGGRRWRKDYDNNEWDWMPCGVACSAGELVVLQNSIGGSTWTSLFNLVPGRIWPFLPDVFVTVGPTDQPDRTFDPAGLPVLTMKFDSFGVDRLESQTGNAHPRDWFMRYLDWLDEFLKKFVRERNQPMMLDEWDPCQDGFYIEGRCRMAGCGNWPVDDLGSMISAAADEPAQGSFNISRCISCCNGYFQKKTAYHGILNSARPECAAALAHCIGDCWSVRNQMYIIAGQGVINSLRGLFRR
jgi:hypothetical protein